VSAELQRGPIRHNGHFRPHYLDVDTIFGDLGVNVNIRNTIFRKDPPSVVSGYTSCNNVAPVTNLCRQSYNAVPFVTMEQKKSCSWNIKTHYLRFKHFIITITDDPSPNPCLLSLSENFEFRHFRPHYLDVDTIFGDLGVNVYIRNTIFRKAPPSFVTMEQKKSCSWNIKTHYLRFKHFIITITDDPSPC
jgi:hypothetical protein